MKDGLFEVGDVIKGLADNGYGTFNEDLLEGEVLEIRKHDNPKLCTMRVLIIDHRIISYIRSKGNVTNSTSKFKLFKEAEEDFWKSLEVL